jgi:hypothetical protein
VLRLRGLSCSDEDTHKLVSWATRKDYPTWIGISLPIKNWVGEDYHEIQFWEDTAEPIQFAHTAIGAYDWLMNRFRSRAANQMLPIGMPDKFENLSVVMYRTGKAGYILFTLLDSFASSLRDQPVKVEVNYQWGYTRLGMGDRYTPMMLATELWTLTQNEWQIYPKQAHETRADGTVCNDTFGTTDEFQQMCIHEFAVILEKYLIAAFRGSSINSQLDRGRLLQYFAWSGQVIENGIAFSVDNYHIEFWFNVTLQPDPDDANLEVYTWALKNLWFERLQETAPQLAVQIQAANVTEYRFEMRYVGNRLRVWFVPAHPDYATWKPLIESPLPRDKWITHNAFALSYPPCPDRHSKTSVEVLFKGILQERYDDPEVQGGKIALIAANSKTVQKPPNCLDRMNARKLKQVAYNERVSQAEDEVSGINCYIADFLSGMSSTATITVCINAGASMKKNETILGGQYWQQEGRAMTATNGVIEGMPNTRESAILTADVEAVEWRHPIESVTIDGKRATPRIVIYPADMSQIEEALSDFSQNPSEAEDGSHNALSKILEHSAEYASLPRFLRGDSSEIQNNPELDAAASFGLSTAAQVSVGSRDYVLENGPDVMNSSDEDSPQEESGEVLTGMYTNGLKAPVLLSQSEVARQRAAAEAFKKVGYGNWIPSSSNCPSSSEAFSESDQSRSQSVPSSPTNSRAGSRLDEPNVPRHSNPLIPRAQTPTGDAPSKPTVSTAVPVSPLTQERRRTQKFISDSSGDELPPPAKLLSSKIVPKGSEPKASTSVEVPPDPPSPKKSGTRKKPATRKGESSGASDSEAPPSKSGSGQKASTRTAVPEGPHPMTTRQKASRAGSLRDGGGSRATDTCVAQGNPSWT